MDPLSPPGAEQRRLQAIMFTDMFGYSRMMGEDEARTIRLVEEHRAIVRSVLPGFGGREHQTIGDAFVVLFDSALNAVSCAVEIQSRLRARNAEQPPEEQVLLRIGIHMDDIVMRDGQIYGDGVNLAARVEPLAEAGGICITEPVLRHVEGKVAFGFVALGEHALKNIAKPPALFAVHVDGAPRPRPIARPPNASRMSLVVGAVLVAIVVVAVGLRMARPLASSRDPQAAEDYANGLRRQADLDIDDMNAAMLAALARDPGLVGAHVRIAGWAFDESPVVARQHFTEAQRGRDRLDAFDRSLLDALAPYLATTTDSQAFVEKTGSAFAEFGSNEHRFWSAFALANAGRWAEAKALAEAGDPEHYLPQAWVAATAALHLPDGEAAGVAHLKRCIEGGPSSTKCLLMLGFYQSRTGQCAAMEQTAREWIARAPTDGNAEDLLAFALAAQSTPVTSVVEVLQRSQLKRPPQLRALSSAADKTRVQAWMGAFDDAEASARAWSDAVGKDPDVAVQIMPSTYTVALLLERGRLAAADAAADAFLRRAPAFQADASGSDWTIYFDNARHAAGALDDDTIDERRTAWLDAQRRKPHPPERLVNLWRDGWGEWVRTPAQAGVALAVLRRLQTEGLVLPPRAMMDPGLALALGQTLLLTDDVTGARSLLEQASTSCTSLLEPLRATRALLMVGKARAAAGEVDGARDAFATVLARWGNVADSVTATAARQGLAALSTAPSP